jgi:uncharacterized iron-regulated protein
MRAVLFIASLWLVGCAATPVAPTRVAPGIYDVVTGEQLSEEQFAGRLISAKYVIVGESHDSPEDHALQLHVYELMSSGRRVALGMEMFQRPFQEPLDLYVRGEIDEATMLERTEWETRWGFETGLYRPLWEMARKKSLPIIALNVQRELTKRVSAVGVAALTEDERGQLVDLDLSREDYRSWLEDIFSGHGMQMDREKFDRFYEAQVLWDETMADSAVNALRQSPGDLDSILIIVGRGHAEFRWGIPSRIERRDPGQAVLVIVRAADPVQLDDAKIRQMADIVIIP